MRESVIDGQSNYRIYNISEDHSKDNDCYVVNVIYG